jgi:uncharacterized cysteine cluster protein YcgN (CxxCxxCC family)
MGCAALSIGTLKAGMTTPFWQSQSLAEMTLAQWESLCDGCGKCCLEKLEDEDTGEIVYTRVACALLDINRCQCRHYLQRTQWVADCVDLRDARFTQYHWLPNTCAYRLLAEGKPLPDWHPLLTGDPASVAAAGHSVAAFAEHVFEVIEDWDDYIVEGLI